MGVFQNNLLAGAAAAASAGGAAFYDYQIEQSMRFDRASDTGLTRTQTTGTSRRTYTYSLWFKVSEAFDNGAAYMLFGATVTSTTNYNDNTNLNNGAGANYALMTANFKGSLSGQVQSNARIRDTGGWYHLVQRVDTTQSTASDRVRLYLNGTQITSFNNETQPSQNYDGGFGINGNETTIGMNLNNSNFGHEFNGYIAEVIYADGTSYAPTQFGNFKNGIWIPKDPTGTSFGDNGHHLKFENASDLGNDSSGNNNDFTVENAGADHQVLDSPTFGS